MGIIGWIVLGLLAGAIAKAVLPGDDPGGIIVTIIIGIVGAILGGFLAQVLFGRDTVDEFFDISTWLTAIIGAILLLLIYRVVAGRGRRRAFLPASSPSWPSDLVRRRASTPPPDQFHVCVELAASRWPTVRARGPAPRGRRRRGG